MDEFVAMSEVSRKKEPRTKMCSDFLAGSELRSSQRYFALDETALFGCACRHEFPHLFINLKHGERLCYAEWLLQEVIQRDEHGIHFCIMYDIACNIVRYLQNSPGCHGLLEHTSFAIPSFHAYGHKADCQVLYSPQRCDGFGLSDGEVMERMWSYLRRFGRMTKEMRPSHRVDMLSHALLYYGFMAKHKLPSLLVQRWNKAKKLKALADEAYHESCSKTGVLVTDELVASWIKVEKSIIKDGVKPTITSEWKLHYFHVLQCYYIAREQLASMTSRNPEMRDRLLRMDSQLGEMEIRCGIQQRWMKTDNEYIDARRLFLRDKLDQSHTCLWSSVIRRLYLLKLKAKYADGQKIAKRLASSISKEMKKTKQHLDQYNETCSQINDPLHTRVAISDVLDPSSHFWVSVAPHQSSDSVRTVPLNVRKDIVQAALMRKRCTEEIEMLQEEVTAIMKYWANRQETIAKCLKQVPSTTDVLYDKGVSSYLRRLLLEAELACSKASSAYNIITPMTTPSLKVTEYEDESDWLPSDSDSDSNDSDEYV